MSFRPMFGSTPKNLPVKKPTLKKMFIGFGLANMDTLMNRWSAPFFANRMKIDEYQEMCEVLLDFMKELENPLPFNKLVHRNSMMIKFSLVAVIVAFILFFLTLFEELSSYTVILFIGFGMSCIGLVTAYIISVVNYFKVPHLNDCIYPISDQIANYIEALNVKYKKKGLEFGFRVNAKELRIYAKL